MRLSKRYLAPLLFFLLTIVPIIAINIYLYHRIIPVDLIHVSEDRFWFFFSNDKYGCLDKTGSVIISPIYESISPFFNGYSQVSLNGNNTFINANGEQSPVTKEYLKERFYHFAMKNKKLAEHLNTLDIYATGRYYFHVTETEISIYSPPDNTPLKLYTPQFPDQEHNARKVIFSEDGFCIKLLNELIEFYDYTGKKLYIFSHFPTLPFSKQFEISDPPRVPAPSSQNMSEDYYIIPDGKPALDGVLLADFSSVEGYLLIKEKSTMKYGYLNTATGELKILPQFQRAHPFHKGYAIVRDANGYRLIDENGAPAEERSYDYISRKDDVYFLKEQGSIVISKNENKRRFCTSRIFVDVRYAWMEEINTIMDLETFQEFKVSFGTPVYHTNQQRCTLLNGQIHTWDQNFEHSSSFTPNSSIIYMEENLFIATTGLNKLQTRSSQEAIYDSRGRQLFKTPLFYPNILENFSFYFNTESVIEFLKRIIL